MTLSFRHIVSRCVKIVLRYVMDGLRRLSGNDYRALAEWRYALRRFLAASEQITRARGVSPTQYQLLLFVRGSAEGSSAIEDLARRLQVRHQSAVGLVDRCVKAGLVRRRRDPENGRRVFVELTRRGTGLLERLAAEHFATIERLGRSFFPPSLRGRVPPAPTSRTRAPKPS
jgi:DNA-binding MarR family transcriptional regulator